MSLIYKAETYAIRGACYEVYKEKGAGFLESVFQECLDLEFGFRGIPYVAQPELELEYKGTKLQSTFRPDFVCYEKIIVEIKAVSDLTEIHRAQVHNYLKATGLRVGLLVNFGYFPKAQIERIVR